MSNKPKSPKPSARVELGRYEIPGGERVLVGQRIEGVVHVSDWPASGRGRRYPVEVGFESFAELAVLVSHYRRHAASLGCCPMSREAITQTFEIAAAEADSAPASHALAGARGAGNRPRSRRGPP